VLHREKCTVCVCVQINIIYFKYHNISNIIYFKYYIISLYTCKYITSSPQALNFIEYILNFSECSILVKSIKLKQKFGLLSKFDFSLIQLYNILEEKMNSSFEYMIVSNTCDDIYFKTIIKNIFFVKENYYLKKRKINWVIAFLGSRMIFFSVYKLILS